MKRLLRFAFILAICAAAVGWFATAPVRVAKDTYATLTGDVAKGEIVFWASGCASCHAAPKAEGADKLTLSGGYRIISPFGTFIAPNISPSPQGIAGWTTYDLANSLIAGVTKSGQHHYPSLPYTTYTKMQPQDVADLKAFLDQLPTSEVASLPHELGFPFSIRRGIGLWKRLNLPDEWVLAEADTPELERGRYLVEALGHCAECHTPRNVMGGLDVARWMQGAPNPSGKGDIPAITPDKLDWSAGDIAYYLETGFTPEFDAAGGQMAKVVEAMSHLSASDRSSIAAYLKALPGG